MASRLKPSVPKLPDIDIETLVRRYVAKELRIEIGRDNSPLVPRVIGEVLASDPVYSELVVRTALKVAEDLAYNRQRPLLTRGELAAVVERLGAAIERDGSLDKELESALHKLKDLLSKQQD